MRSLVSYGLLLLTIMCWRQADAQKMQPLQGPARFTLPVGITAKDYRPGVIILKIKPEVAAAKIQSAAAAVSQVKVSNATIVSVTRRFYSPENPAAQNTSALAASNSLNRIFELKFSGQADIVAVINQLLSEGSLEYAEPDYINHHFFAVNDPQYGAGNLSYLDQIKAPQAWDVYRNSSSVVIGIVDSGSDLLHQDLAANIYENTADPVNGIDDDHDGYIDNFHGWDLVGVSGSSIKEDNDPNVKSDTTAHGIHVSGLAGAVSNNAVGVASVGFNAKLLIVKCGADNDGEAIYRGYDGIKYAADHGAQVINCSWGGTGGGSFGKDVIDYVISKGCLVVAAAGNESSSVPNYPAAYPGVLSVAAVSGTDVRSSFSNYHQTVGISAPGNSILSTLRNNTYGRLSGTSMASPIVAGAAALLKAAAPSLTMAQVGERLKATSDNIDAKNPNFVGLLGKGRLNVFRALTEFPPAVRYQKITLNDKGNGTIPAGDTLSIYFDITNFLAPVNDLNIHLSSGSSAVTIPGADQSIAGLGTNENRSLVGPFKVYVKAGTPDNTAVTFKIAYAGNNGAYINSETFTINVSIDHFNIEVNKISTTFTSVGRIGYSEPNSADGLGFLYKNQNLLFEGGLMIGKSPLQVSDNVRTGNAYNEHFVKQKKASKEADPTAAFAARAEFNDAGSPSPLPVYVEHRGLAWSAAPDDKYAIFEYEVSNPGSTDLKGIYVGLLTDWDIGAGTNNVTKFDESNRLGYVSVKGGNSLFGGVKLLTSSALPAYYPLAGQVPGDLTFDNIFTTAEKFATLSSGIKATSLGENSANGYDVLFVSGYGPFDIPAGESVTVAFALIGGDNLADLTASAAAAQAKYNQVNPQAVADQFTLYQNYPNPVKSTTIVPFDIPATGNVTLTLFDLSGKKVRSYLNQTMIAGKHSFTINSTDLVNGLYFCQLKYEGQKQTIKVLVNK